MIHEDAIKVGGQTKAPDNCFRVGGRRIFFLEAKKPAVNVREDAVSSYQLRRYGWSAKLPLSILSSFEWFAVYDCRVKPKKNDKAAPNRVMLVHYLEYIERWGEIAGIFAREAVLKGSFDKFAESTKLKRGTEEVDAAFLGEIESWRDLVRANYGRKIRELLTSAANIDRIVDLAALPVFRGATVRTIVLLTTKAGEKSALAYSPQIDLETFAGVESGTRSLDAAVDPAAFDVPFEQLSPEGWNLGRPRDTKLLARLRRAGRPLVDVVGGKICMGVKSGLIDAFVVSRKQRNAMVRANPRAAEVLRPFLQGRDIRAYLIENRDEYLIYTHKGIDMAPYPAVLEHLLPFKQRLQERATKQEWYELQQPQWAYRELMERPKIVFPDIATTCRFALDTAGLFGANTVYFLPTDDPALLGILNSRLAHFYFAQTCAALEGAGETYLRFFGQYLERFPVCTVEAGGSKRRESMTDRVAHRSRLSAQLEAAKTPDAKIRVQRAIDAAGRQIDQLAYVRVLRVNRQRNRDGRRGVG